MARHKNFSSGPAPDTRSRVEDLATAIYVNVLANGTQGFTLEKHAADAIRAAETFFKVFDEAEKS